MPISFEISGPNRREAPPFADGCPKCHFDGAVIPFATHTEGDRLMALYEHGRCGHQWQTDWDAQWSPAWQRVTSTGQQAIAA